MIKNLFANVSIVLGVGVLVWGLASYQGGGSRYGGGYNRAGLTDEARYAVAVGAMLVVGGVLGRRR